MRSIWAHTLVKNEARWLWYSVSSVADFVEKILLWDTGSSDGTFKIIKELEKKFPGKIEFRERPVNSAEEFATARQEMLDATKSDWILMLDGDEIWWDGSIRKVCETINKKGEKIESIIVPTINPVGDIFHYQEEAAGKYKFGKRQGHFNLRAVRRSIPGLHIGGVYGNEGWVDGEGRRIQDRGSGKMEFVEAPYLHATYLQRAGEKKADSKVLKRKMKLKYELGIPFAPDYYYPEVFFKTKPEMVESLWQTASLPYKFRAFFETPLRKIKRRIWEGRAGY